MSKSKNVKNLIMNVLPDNRPITSLQIVEDFEKCPRNFSAIHKTYDQDADADLWRETSLLFGKHTGRYLCLSKSEGLPEYIVETLKVIAEREHPPEGFSLLSRTADTEQKAWRKRQIIYKLSRRGAVVTAVTDIILCSKLKTAPAGFLLAGEINGIAICYKLGSVAHRPPPLVPQTNNVPNKTNGSINDLENSVHYLNIKLKPPCPLPETSNGQNNYEILRTSYQISSSNYTRSVSKIAGSSGSTLSGTHNELDGVPFLLHPNLNKTVYEMPNVVNFPNITDKLEYDFHLERQVLCTTKSSATQKKNLKNPFFNQ